MRRLFLPFAVSAVLTPAAAMASNQQSPTNTPVTLTAIEDVTRGSSVAVQGTVGRILDSDEFRLVDDTGSIDVYIGWQNQLPVKSGEQVTVKGVVDDDGSLELYAKEIIHGNGQTTRLKPDN
jgi:uncharacterized protein YdeI (BOF family)